jgi:hypothetical protein
MALIAIIVVTVQGAGWCTSYTSYLMTSQTKRFIHHSPGIVFTGYGSGGAYIRTVSTVARNTVTAMVTDQIAHARTSGWVAHHAFIRCNRSSFLSSLMALVAITVVTVQGIICRVNRASHFMTCQTKRFIHHSPGIVLNRYGCSGAYIRAVCAVAGNTVTYN